MSNLPTQARARLLEEKGVNQMTDREQELTDALEAAEKRLAESARKSFIDELQAMVEKQEALLAKSTQQSLTLLDEHAKLKAKLEASEASAAAMRTAIEGYDAAIWDRFYANGPLSTEYAQSIDRKIKTALASNTGADLLAELKRLREANVRLVGALQLRGEHETGCWADQGSMYDCTCVIQRAIDGVG